MITLNLPYPVSLNRMYRVFKGRIVPSQEATRWGNEVRYIASRLKPTLTYDDVNMVVEIQPKLTITGRASKQLVDIDAPLKKLFDALEGIVYANDKQIRRLYVYYGKPVEDGGLIVTITKHE